MIVILPDVTASEADATIMLLLEDIKIPNSLTHTSCQGTLTKDGIVKKDEVPSQHMNFAVVGAQY